MLISYWIPKLFVGDNIVKPEVFLTYEGEETNDLEKAYPFEDKRNCAKFCTKLSAITKKRWLAVEHIWDM